LLAAQKPHEAASVHGSHDECTAHGSAVVPVSATRASITGATPLSNATPESRSGTPVSSGGSLMSGSASAGAVIELSSLCASGAAAGSPQAAALAASKSARDRDESEKNISEHLAWAVDRPAGLIRCCVAEAVLLSREYA
jgi:hypothetical protein